MFQLIVVSLAAFVGLSVQPIQHNAKTVYSWQNQGGQRQTIQVTARNSITPQPATATTQGDSEASDRLQPAAGYAALNWKLQ